MSANKIISRCHPWQVVQEFGGAKLAKLPNGQFGLIGGSAADVSAAKEWVSLFAHSLTFTHFDGEILAADQPEKAFVIRSLTPF
jgi:hypothetical protein